MAMEEMKVIVLKMNMKIEVADEYWNFTRRMKRR